jgi:hypothetical protein
MTDFNFNEHPVIGFIITLISTMLSLCLNIVHSVSVIDNGLKGLASIGQILACTMTIYVGYHTVKKIKEKK